MELERRLGLVRVWWGDRWELTDDEDGTREASPDIVMPEARANWFVMEMLRGPMGPVGPMGPQGVSARAHVHQLPDPRAGVTKREQEL